MRKYSISLIKDNMTLVFILSIALAVRLYNLTDSIWYDEAYTIWTSKLTLPELMRESAHPAFAPPLHYLILHYWIMFFGDSVASLRAPSIFYGWLSVWMIYLVSRQIFSKNVSLASAAFLAFSMFQVFYSEEIRMYSLLTLLSITSAYFLLRLRLAQTPFHFWGYILSSIALLYTHNFAMFAVLAQSLYFLMLVTFWKQHTVVQFKTFLISQIIIGLSFIPWAINLLDIANSWQQEGYWSTYPSLKIMVGLAGSFSGSKYILPILLGLMGITAIWPHISKRFFGKNEYAKKYALHTEWLKTHYRETFFLALWLIIPIAIPYFMSVLIKPAFVERYTISAQAPFCILMARFIFSIGAMRRVQIAIVIGFAGLQLLNLANYFKHDGRNQRDWKGASAYIDSHAQPGDYVLFFSGEFQLPFDYYVRRSDIFRKNITGEERKFYSRLAFEDNDIRMSEMKDFLPKQDRVWVIAVWRGAFKKSAFKFKRHLELTEYIEKKGLDIYLFEKKRPPSTEP